VVKIYLVLTMGVCLSQEKMDGKTVIVTGANSGIGKETALDMACRGARVIMACRSVAKAYTTRDEIISQSGNGNVVIRELDLASLTSVRNFAAGILASEPRLDVLINNAGCAGLAEKQLTEDGLEHQMQANFFGPFLLTNLLLGLLKATAPSRIINVSSLVHSWAKDLDFANLNSELNYDPGQIYYASKLCQILSARHLAPLIIKSGVTVNSLHPGVVRSGLFRNAPLWIQIFFDASAKLLFKTPKEGAQTSIHLAVAYEVAAVTGQYFSDCNMIEASDLATNDGLAKKLWETSEVLVKLTAEERHF